jgi:uncharacterized low-complexity protein
MNKRKHTAIALSVCSTLVAATGTAQAGLSIDQSPFAMQDLGSGYLVADSHEGTGGEKHKAEGKCGEGKCGGEKKSEKEGKCGEGKCGAEKKVEKEGKCGEGKCGAKQ